MSRFIQRHALQKLTFLVVAILTSLIICYRYQIINQFSVLFGDDYDTVIEISILHHWKNVFFNGETWSSTQYFFPYLKTLGYNDGYFLFGILYSISQFFTKSPFISNDVTGIFLHVIGFCLFYIMCRTVFRFQFISSIFGSFIFVTSNNIWINSAHHIQILMIYFIPALIILFYISRENYISGNRKRSYLYALCCSALCAACFMTGYYILWFFVFSICILLATVSTISCIRGNIKSVFNAEINLYPYYFILLSSFITLMVPFLYVYLSKARETGMHSWEETYAYLPHPYDLLHIGHWNGGVIFAISVLNQLGQWGVGRDLVLRTPYHFSELLVGFPPVTLALAFWGAWAGTRYGTARYSRTIWLIFSVTNIIILLLCFKLGPLSLWQLVFHLVPGAKGLRVVSRFFLYETLPLCIALSLACDFLLQRRQYVLTTVLLLIVVCEQVNFSPVLGLSLNREQALYDSVPDKPAQCKAFVVADTPPAVPDSGYDLYHGNSFAMLYSELAQIPTPMGFSTFNPPDWDFSSPYDGVPGVTDIAVRAVHYASAHNFLPGLCELSITKNTASWRNLRSIP
ncbi:hypothetical protein [Komagataeibacter oboediens]|uniref:hypothetical protein n=1 Tax=Komagataeibacter oboediens TaxID=65958 RepID=UPI0011B41EBE|nr:hypothetical protein [Komagataeibacter oboediens]